MEISLEKIESELSRLWEAQAKTSMAKACLFNLIVYTHEPRRTKYFQDVIHSIIEKFPCRIIFIQGDPSSDQDYLKVEVSAQTIGKGNSVVACEQIIIKVAGKQFVRVPYLILPHFVADLPIYLLWGQDPTRDNEILPLLEKFASLLIFDSECTENLPQFSEELLQRIKEWKIDLIDMNWLAVAGWRDVLAKTFDSSERINQLTNCQSIQIDYNHTPSDQIYHNYIPALYLQAWMAAQLKWEWQSIQKSNAGLQIVYKNSNNILTIILKPIKNSEFPPGAIINCNVIAKDNQTFSIMVSSASPQAVVHISNAEQCNLPFTLPLPRGQNGKTLINEIFYRKKNGHYINMLKIIAQG